MHKQTFFPVYKKQLPLPDWLAIEVKALKINIGYPVANTSNDAFFKSLIEAVTACFSSITWRDLQEVEYQVTFDCWEKFYKLEKAPFVSIESVKYIDENNIEQLVGNSDYYPKNDITYAFLFFDEDFDFPDLRTNRPDNVIVNFKVGIASDTKSVPSEIQLALAQWATLLYRDRGDCACDDVASLKPSFTKGVINKYRIQSLGVSCV